MTEMQLYMRASASVLHQPGLQIFYLVNGELNRFERAKGREDLLDVALTDIASQVSNMKPGGLQDVCVPVCLDLHGCNAPEGRA